MTPVKKPMNDKRTPSIFIVSGAESVNRVEQRQDLSPKLSGGDIKPDRCGASRARSKRLNEGMKIALSSSGLNTRGKETDFIPYVRARAITPLNSIRPSHE